MNIKHILQTFQTMSYTPTQRSQPDTVNGLVVRTGIRAGDAAALGSAIGSPGVLSGNLAQVPVHVPVNVNGRTMDILDLLNPAFKP